MRKLALLLAGATAAILVVMVGVSLATGATQEAHEHYHPPAEYAAGLLAHPNALRLLFGLDIAFLVLYSAFFAAFAKYLRDLGRPFAMLALGAMLGTAVLDIVEDHHILALLAMAEHGRPIDDSTIAFQEVLSSTKFSDQLPLAGPLRARDPAHHEARLGAGAVPHRGHARHRRARLCGAAGAARLARQRSLGRVPRRVRDRHRVATDRARRCVNCGPRRRSRVGCAGVVIGWRPAAGTQGQRTAPEHADRVSLDAAGAGATGDEPAGRDSAAEADVAATALEPRLVGLATAPTTLVA